ncbi:MAG TPA: EamA family transporter [Steroidobacteraceae bacterium]|nr:EamA family transporter [Steroidobacteraceae bacterium]
MTIFSVQFGAGFAKRLFPLFGVEMTTALRLCVGALLLLPVLRPWRLRLPRRAWPAILLFGAVLAGMNLSFYLAIQRIPLGIAVALEFTGPLTLAALTSRRPIHLLWVGLAALGVLLLLPLSHSAPSLDLTGVLLALGAACAWALYTVLGQRIGAAWGTPVITFSMAAGGLLLLPVALLRPHHFGFAPRELGDALMVGLFSSALPYPLELFALARISTRAYGTLTSLEPAVGTLMGLLVLRELPTAVQLAGIAAVVAASVGTTTAGRS